MSQFSFGKYANPPYDIITREFQGNKHFHAKGRNFIIIAGIIGFLFLTVFLFTLALMFIAFLVAVSINKDARKVRDIVCYYLDYNFIMGLERSQKLKISPQLRSHLPSAAQIKHDLGADSINVQNSSHQQEEVVPQKSEITQELDFDFSKFETKQNTISQTTPASDEKTSLKKKSIFDDYVSVSEIFKNMKNR